jgi:hypothetical protein
MAIWVIRCMPPSGPYNKVRSLRECFGLGTPPWSGNLEQTAVFLGAESLICNVVTLCRPAIFQDLEYEYEQQITPTGRINYERSAVAHPILFAGRIAGALLVSSTQKKYFLSQVSTDLIQRYADLVALAFDPQEFYSPEQIALSIMPSPEEQRVSLAKFRQLVYQTMRDAAQKNQLVSNTQASLLVWQRLEDEFLGFPTLTSAYI